MTSASNLTPLLRLRAVKSLGDFMTARRSLGSELLAEALDPQDSPLGRTSETGREFFPASIRWMQTTADYFSATRDNAKDGWKANVIRNSA